MIARINLLPWRQRCRDRQRRAFLAQLGLVAAGAAILAFAAGTVLDRRIAEQNARNSSLVEHIGQDERRIDEIDLVRRRVDATLDRLRTLSDLRRDRAATAHIFEELVRTLVPGVHYTSLVQRGSLITARGVAGSNNDIAALMRNLKDSDRFDAPRLKRIDEVVGEQDARPTAVFELTFATTVPDAGVDR